MKNVPREIPAGSLEILEARIAPAGVFIFTDTDGDAVTVSSTRGTNADLAAAIQPFLNPSGMGVQLQKIALSSAPAIFKGTTLVVSASQTLGGNGFVDIGYIDATGLDLGSVTIDGDLGQIDAGDANVQTRALASLSAVSLGVRSLATQGAGGSLVSTVFGPVGSLVLSGDLRDATFQVLGSAVDPDPSVHSATDAAGRIGAVRIDGSVIGGAATGSGQIFAKGRISTIEIGGNISGGAGAQSGRVWTEGGTDSATIEGSIVGGSDPGAASSGQLFAGGRTSRILVEGKLMGGAGEDSGLISNGRGLGSVTILGGIEGGAGDRSGTVASAASISLVSIASGGVVGGAGEESGAIRATVQLKTAQIVGDVRGGVGERSGIVGSDGTIGKLTVEGSVFGGIGEQSGALGSLGALGDVKVTGDLRGGSGPRSGQIVSTTNIKSVTVDGSVAGGAAFESGAIGSHGRLGPVKIGSDLIAGAGDFSGTIQAGAADVENGTPASIVSVTIGRDIKGVATGGTVGENAAAILSDGALGPVIVLGNVQGGANDSVGTIFASTIKSVRIDGSLLGGSGESSGVISASVSLGPVTIGQSVLGGGGEFSGAIRSGGDMGAVKIGGTLAGGDGDFSGAIETQGDPEDSAMGAVKITGAILGGSGMNSGSIHSSGKLASVEAAELRGFSGTAGRTIGLGSGGISSDLDMGAVKITGSILGGTGDESGKINSGGKLASLTLGGSLVGGSGHYDTTEGNLNEIGQVFVEKALGPVKIGAHIAGGSGAHSAEIRAASIKSVNIATYMDGGSGESSGGLVSTSGDIGDVTLGASIGAGSAPLSGFITSAARLLSLRASGMESEGGSRVLISALDEIRSIIVTGSVSATDIIAGMDIEGNITKAGAQIGTVSIAGDISTTNIVASALRGTDDEYGTFDDRSLSDLQESPLISKIASVIIGGSIVDDGDGEFFYGNFGIVADHVVRVKVGTETIAQQSGPRNDFIQIGDSTLAINELEVD